MSDDPNKVSMELMRDILRNIQSVQASHSENFRDIKDSLISLREDVHGTRGEVLRLEKALAAVE